MSQCKEFFCLESVTVGGGALIKSSSKMKKDGFSTLAPTGLNTELNLGVLLKD